MRFYDKITQKGDLQYDNSLIREKRTVAHNSESSSLRSLGLITLGLCWEVPGGNSYGCMVQQTAHLMARKPITKYKFKKDHLLRSHSTLKYKPLWPKELPQGSPNPGLQKFPLYLWFHPENKYNETLVFEGHSFKLQHHSVQKLSCAEC